MLSRSSFVGSGPDIDAVPEPRSSDMSEVDPDWAVGGGGGGLPSKNFAKRLERPPPCLGCAVDDVELWARPRVSKTLVWASC